MYSSPPAPSSTSCTASRLVTSAGRVSTAAQPSAMYNHEPPEPSPTPRRTIFMITPASAVTQTTTSNGMPQMAGRAIRHTGVYVPAIST